MIVKGLNEQAQGTNRVISGSCSGQAVELTVKLSPGEANRLITNITLTNTSCVSAIYQVDYITYANPLTVPFTLTQNNSLSIILQIDPCGAPATTDTLQLTITTSGPALTLDYYYDLEFVDFANVISTIIPSTDAYLIECLNLPNTNQSKFFEFTNPTDIPLRIEFTPSLAGLNWEADGISLINYFNVPANQTSVLSFSNPWGVTPANFTIDVYVGCNYSALQTLNATWTQVVCGDCGINCSGLSIGTNPGWIETVPAPQTPDSGTSWQINSASGLGSVSASYFTDVNDAWVTWNNPNNPPLPGIDEGYIILVPFGFNAFWFPPSTPTLLQFEITIKFGAFNMPLLTPSLPPPVPYSIEFIPINGTGFTQTYATPFTQNTSYIISGTVPDFSYNSIGDWFGQIRIWIPEAQSACTMYIDDFSLKVVGPSIPDVDLDCSTLDLYNYSAIGDYKEVVYDLFYMNGWQNDVQLFFNPWLFSDTGDFTTYFGAQFDQPSSGYVVRVNGSWVGDGLWHDMSLFGVNNSIGPQKNWTCKIKIIDQNAFEVKFSFFVTMDMLEWVQDVVVSNQKRLLAGSNNDVLYDASLPSVFTNNKQFGAYFYIIDSNVIVNGNPFECHFIRNVFFTARFWNKGLYLGASEMTNPTFNLTRNAAAVSSLSAFVPTEVEFTIDYSNPVDSVTAWIIADNTTNNLQDFYYNYDASRATIPTLIAGVLNKDIQAPSQGPTLVAGNTYNVKFNVGTGLDPNLSYRILMVCYSSTDSMVNSFLSDKLNVATCVDLSDISQDLDITSTWQDYNTSYTDDCVALTMQQWYNHKLEIDGGALGSTLVGFFGGAWYDYLSNITINVYRKVVDTPISGQTTFIQYQTAKLTKFVQPAGVIWQSNSPSFSAGMASGKIYTTYSNNVTFLDSAFDPTKIYIANTSTIMDRVQAPTAWAQNFVASNNIQWTWAGQDVYFEYVFNWAMPCSGVVPVVNTASVYKMYAIPYEPNPTPYTSELNALEVFGVDGLGNETPITSQFCDTTYVYLKVKVSGSYATGKLVAHLLYTPYTLANMKEETSFASPVGMAQRTCLELYQVDSDFVSNEAYFRVKLSALAPGNYRIAAIHI